MYHYLVAVNYLRHSRKRLSLATLAVAERSSYAILPLPHSTTFTTMNLSARYSASCWTSNSRAIWRFLCMIFIFANATAVSAIPLDRFARQRRQSTGAGDNQSNSGGLSTSVWVPIMVVAIAFLVLSLLACLRRSMNRELATASAHTNTTTNATTAQPAADNTAASNRRRRRPRRTPSQISTKSLPPYMKEPGDHELVIYRGPLDMEQQSPNGMPTLGEVEETVDPSVTHFNISLDRMVTRDTLPDASSTAHLTRNVSRDTNSGGSIDAHSLESSLQSHGSNIELLVSHSRTLSNTDNSDPRGEAPPYAVAVAGAVSTLSFPQPSAPPALGAPGPQHVQDAPRSRFSFLFHPFTSHSNSGPRNTASRPASSSAHVRSESAFSLNSSEHGSSTRPTTPSGSRSHLLGSRDTRTRASSTASAVVLSSPSMISLNSISAPLPHTLTRAEFRIPRGGLTPEQIKIITARDAPERFGRPYGPAAVAFAGSRGLLSEDTNVPPPGFEEVFGASEGADGSIVDSAIDNPNTPDTLGNNNPSGVFGAELPGPIETGISSTSSSDISPTSLPRPPSLSSDQQQELARLRVDMYDTSIPTFTIADSEEPMTPHTARPRDFVAAIQA
ncbi:hypothetical protein V8B97DRAFT_2022029 [Scleroderma yunnanense]